MTDAVRSRNRAFYRAINGRDTTAMDQLWARRLPVACIHPGWAVLSDRRAILASWQAILTGREPPQILCLDDTVMLYGDVAVVTCEEDLAGTILAATNIFVREDAAWHLVHHQAGPLERRLAPMGRVVGNA